MPIMPAHTRKSRQSRRSSNVACSRPHPPAQAKPPRHARAHRTRQRQAIGHPLSGPARLCRAETSDGSDRAHHRHSPCPRDAKTDPDGRAMTGKSADQTRVPAPSQSPPTAGARVKPKSGGSSRRPDDGGLIVASSDGPVDLAVTEHARFSRSVLTAQE